MPAREQRAYFLLELFVVPDARRGMRTSIVGMLMALGALLASCSGGQVAGDSTTGKVLGALRGEPVIPRAANTIIIPFFRDYSGEPTVSDVLTIRLRDAISMDGRLAIVADNEKADLRLVGKVMLYRIQPVHYSTSGEPVRKRLMIAVIVSLVDQKNQRDIFRNRQVQSFEIFSDVVPPVVPESQARDLAVESLARRIAVQTVSGWYTDLMSREERGK